MTGSIDARAKHREHIQRRTEYVRDKRGPVSYVWGNHVVKPRQRVPGAPGLWSPLPEGEAGLLVEASASDGIVIDGRTVDGAAKLAVGPNHPAIDRLFLQWLRGNHLHLRQQEIRPSGLESEERLGATVQSHPGVRLVSRLDR